MGPVRIVSLGGAKYFLSIIDDYSRRVWIIVLKSKFETFNKFKDWMKLVENQTGRIVKKIRSDNGLEFCNKEFKLLCKGKGIGRHLSVPVTPQKNGLAEKINMTLLNKVRCLLSSSGLPKNF
jgi:transposase InsO family protein